MSPFGMFGYQNPATNSKGDGQLAGARRENES